MRTGTTKAQKYREAFFFRKTVKRSSVERATRLEGPFGCPAEYFDVALYPGEDVAGRRSAVAGRQVVDLGDREFPVPDVQVCQLANVSLRGVKASSQHVLWNDGDKR